MKATISSELLANQGMFGGKTLFKVQIHVQLEGDEEAIIRSHSPYDPLVKDSVELSESSLNRLAKQGGERASGYVRGVTMEFESIQQAGKFEDGVLDALRKYRVQVDAARSRISVLGSQRDFEL